VSPLPKLETAARRRSTGRSPVRRRGLARGEVVLIAAVMAAGAAVVWRGAGRSGGAAARAACRANLEAIGRALSAYVAQNDQRWPAVARLPSMEYHDPRWPGLAEVLAPLIPERGVFRCPGDERVLDESSPLRAQFPARTTYYETEGSSYEWVLQELRAGQRVGRDPLARASGAGLGPADQPIVWEYRPFHGSAGEPGAFHVLYADFVVRPSRGEDRR